MTDAIQKLLGRVRKLLAHTTSAEEIGNVAEAAAFAAKARELLAAHHLSMSDVEFAASASDIGDLRVGAAGLDLRGRKRRQRLPSVHSTQESINVTPSEGSKVTVGSLLTTLHHQFSEGGRYPLHGVARAQGRPVPDPTVFE